MKKTMFEGLSRSLSQVFSKITGRTSLDQKTIDETLDRVVDALLQADVPYDVAHAFSDRVKREVEHKQVPRKTKPDEHLMHVVHTQLSHFLGQEEDAHVLAQKGVVMVMGLQGSGKTTTVVKLARTYMQAHASVLIGSVDFARPAAVDQLHVYAQEAGVTTYQARSDDPTQAAAEIVAYGRQQQYDVIIVDTAGRLHIDDAMIAELDHIQKAIKPDTRCLVLDAMTGQASIEVARTFTQSIGFDAGILTKMDSDTRGGAAFAFRYALEKPIVYCGCGEKIDDLEPFRPERIARRMLDMGDLLTLSEKAEQRIQEEEAQTAYERMQQGTMTLEDFAQQLRMMQKLGSFGHIMQYIPGASSFSMSDQEIERVEQELKQFRVMMNSMTPKEKRNPGIINRSRRERIARGAGVKVSDVKHLLDRFHQSKQMMQMMKNMGGLEKLLQS